MEFIPVVFFGILFLYIIKKKGFDVSAFVTLLYLITSVFSLIMFRSHMVEEKYSHPSIIATITYCALLFLSILPIYHLNLQKVDLLLSPKTEKKINELTYVFLFNLILFLFIRFKDLSQVINSGDYLVLRQDVMSGDVGHASGFMGLLAIITNIMSSVSFVMILVFFISITYYKKSWWFNIFAFLGSLPQVLSGILTINRSNVFYYIIIFALCYMIFRKRVPNKMKLRFFLPIGAVFVAMMYYFSAVTVSRFEDNRQYGGVNGGLISYAGMAYSNYCYFFDYYKNPDWASTRYLMPVTNYVINGYRGGTDREQEQSLKTGFNCVVFMTFLGSFMMDSNQIMPSIVIIIYLFLFHLCRSHIHNHHITFVWLLAVFLLMIVPSVGCISYFYTSPFKSMALYSLLLYTSIK